MRSTLRSSLFLALISAYAAACVTTAAPQRPPVADGSEIRFYPDACRSRGGLQGDVLIQGATGLDEVSRVPCITGSLTIEATALRAVELSRLSEVGGDLIIRDNGQLRSLDLPLLRIVGGAVLVLNQPRLERASLPQLTVAGDHVIIGRHRDLDAALAETSPGSALVTVELGALKALGGALVFRDNPKLERFSVPKVERIGDGLLVERNHALTDFSIASGARILRTISIEDNRALPNLRGLAHLLDAQGDLVLRELPALRSLEDLRKLRKVKGSLRITKNNLRRLELPALETIGGTFEVLEHVDIPRLDFPVLRSVGDRIEIHGNNSLEALHLPALSTVGGNLDLSANFALSDVSIPALGRLDGDFGVVDNTSLVVIGAPQLTEIKDNLVIKANAALTGVDFPALTAVSGFLTIQDNLLLESLDGLGKVTKIGVKLYVHDNPKLPDCAATALRDQLHPDRPLWGEDIGGNGPDSNCR